MIFSGLQKLARWQGVPNPVALPSGPHALQDTAEADTGNSYRTECARRWLSPNCLTAVTRRKSIWYAFATASGVMPSCRVAFAIVIPQQLQGVWRLRMDWSKFDLAMTGSRYLHGTPVFRDEPRMPVQAVLDKAKPALARTAARIFPASTAFTSFRPYTTTSPTRCGEFLLGTDRCSTILF